MYFQDAIGPYPSSESRFYEVKQGSVTYAAALTLSSLFSYRGVLGHLLTIDNDVEGAFVKHYASSYVFWLSIFRRTVGPFAYSSGPLTGSNLTYSNWYPGHPSNSSDQCADLSTFSGQWFDTACTTYLPYIIEYECAKGYVFNATGCTGSYFTWAA